MHPILLLLTSAEASTIETLEAHRSAQIAALDARDLDALGLLFVEPGRVDSMLDAPWTTWYDRARRLEGCTFGALQLVAEDQLTVERYCEGGTERITFREIEGRWRQGDVERVARPAPRVNVLHPSQLVPGPPIQGHPHPALPIEIELSPTYQLTGILGDDDQLAAIATVPGACDDLGVDRFSGRFGAWRTKTLTDGRDPTQLQAVDTEAGCVVRVVWDGPDDLGTAYGCNTKNCRVRRGEIEPDVPYPDPFTAADLEANRGAVRKALEDRDLEALMAIVGERMWSAWFSAEDEKWEDELRRRQHCETGPIRMRGPDEARVVETCPGSKLDLVFRRDGDGWTVSENGRWSSDPRLAEVQTAWIRTGPAIEGVEAPEPPIPLALSAPFVRSGTKLGATASLPDCSAVDAVEARSISSYGTTRTLMRLRDGDQTFDLKYGLVDGTCRILLTWDAPAGVRYAEPYGCNTPYCKERRGQPVTTPQPSFVVHEGGKKRSELRWSPTPGARATRQVHTARHPTYEAKLEGPLARLFPKADDPSVVKRGLHYTLTTSVDADGRIRVEEGPLQVDGIDEPELREKVEAREAERKGTRWPGYRVKGGRALPNLSFTCDANRLPRLPDEKVGPGARWTEVTVDVPLDVELAVTRDHHLTAVTADTLSFETTVRVTSQPSGQMHLHCEATGAYTVDRASLAMEGDFTSTLTFEASQEILESQQAVKVTVTERTSVGR